MNDLAQTGFDYGDLPAEKVLECETAFQAACAIEEQATRMIGEQFAKVKNNLKDLRNGEGWRGWCEKRLGFSHTQAQNYINEYENGGLVKNLYKFGKSSRFLLTAPTMPQEVRDRADALAEAGEDVSVKTIKKIKADYEAERQARELAERRNEEWKAQWKGERDKAGRLQTELDIAKSLLDQPPDPVIVEKTVIPDDYEQLKKTERDLRGDLAELKQQQRELVQQQVVAKLKERESELAELDRKVKHSESLLTGLQTQIDRYSMQQRELKVHLDTIETARTAMAMLAANLEGFGEVIDHDHELRQWHALADMLRHGAAAIEHFIGDAHPALTVVRGDAA